MIKIEELKVKDIQINHTEFKNYLFYSLFEKNDMENHLSYIEKIIIRYNRDTSENNSNKYLNFNYPFPKFLNDRNLAINYKKYEEELNSFFKENKLGLLTHSYSEGYHCTYSNLEIEQKTIINNLLLISLNNAILFLLKEKSKNKTQNILIILNENFNQNLDIYAHFR